MIKCFEDNPFINCKAEIHAGFGNRRSDNNFFIIFKHPLVNRFRSKIEELLSNYVFILIIQTNTIFIYKRQ